MNENMFSAIVVESNKVFPPTLSKLSATTTHTMCSLKPAKVEQYPERFPFLTMVIGLLFTQFSNTFTNIFETIMFTPCSLLLCKPISV